MPKLPIRRARIISSARRRSNPAPRASAVSANASRWTAEREHEYNRGERITEERGQQQILGRQHRSQRKPD
ncbi:MAG: hypothetical protein WB580_10295 [Candidatus Binataceae bacterium]